jgi:hypothetical protein
MKEYFEAHVTMEDNYYCDRYAIKNYVEFSRWKFSAIDGDINMGPGTKFYATRQFNLKIGKDEAIRKLHEMAKRLREFGANVVREKIEQVIYDNRKGKCDGNCFECIGDVEEAKEKLVSMGIHNPDGTLTDNYK